MQDLTGKHALVTGGGSGVGAAIALQLVDKGATVTIVGRREAPLIKLAALHNHIDWLSCDVSKADSVATVCSQIADRHGLISIAVANAGTATSKPFTRMQVSDLQAMLEVNLTGVFNTWQACVTPMLVGDWGRLIAVSSMAGLKGYPYVTGYCAAKHAVIGLTRSLALELANTGITVNAICPGFVESPMLDRTLDNIADKTGLSRTAAAEKLKAQNPQHRFIHPDEVADSVIWLCGQQARSITGHALPLSGGET